MLNKMILDNLQLEMARYNNISASPDQVNNALENIAKQNNLNIYNFKKYLEKEGIDFDEFKDDLEKQLTIMNVQRAAANSDITISEQEIKQALKLMENQNTKNSYRLSHILLSVPENPDSAKIKFAKTRAEKIYSDLKGGKDFAKVAKIASDGQHALEGGDLGWLNITEVPSIFTDIVPKLKKGELYGPIQSESGFHIIKLADVKHDDSKYQEVSYKVRHILIKKDDITTSQVAELELKKLKREIEVNDNFADLALIYSEDYGSASRGGEIGWVNKYAVVSEFAGVMESLKKNEISLPFETRFGWHIVQLLDKKLVDNTEEWQKNKARQMLSDRKFQDALAKWQNKLRSDAHIKILV